jgi:hypothetical protein
LHLVQLILHLKKNFRIEIALLLEVVELVDSNFAFAANQIAELEIQLVKDLEDIKGLEG